MKVLVAIIFCAIEFCAAQTLPTNGLIIQYDMLTTSGGGTTLNDLSGNSNNGTIHGTTTSAQGRVFNGTSDYVSVPQLIGNSNFTALAIASSSASTGRLWGESDNVAGQFTMMSTIPSWTAVSGSSAAVIASNWPSGQFKPPDYDLFILTRAQATFISGIESRVNGTTTMGANIGTVTTTAAALGCLNEGASQIQFWAGTISYFVLYNRSLSNSELQTAYNAMAAAVLSRPVFIHPYPPSIIPNITAPVWQRIGPVLKPSGTYGVQEPMVLFDTNPQLIAGTNVFKLWYSASASSIGYAESLDGITWTVGSPLSSLSGHRQAAVVKVSGTYHGYFANTTDTQIDHFTAPDGVTWTLVSSAVIAEGGVNAWDSSAIANPSVLFNPDGSGNWYMLYGGNSNTGPWQGFRTGGATSPDGNTWTKITANPMMGNSDNQPQSGNCCGNPSLQYVNGTWWDWDGSATGGLVRFTSPVFNGLWIWSQPHVSVAQAGFDENSQIADPSILEVNGKTYMYYAAYSSNSNALGVLKVVIANMPMSLLVSTNEGTTTDRP